LFLGLVSGNLVNVTSLAVLGWHVDFRTAETTICAPPGGRTLAWAEIRERESPLRAFHQLVAQRAEALRAEGVSALSVERAQRLITSEGELGAITTISGVLGSEPIEHGLAVVYAEATQMTVDGRAARADQRTAVRAVVHELATHVPVGGGERLRRFWYLPPDEWQGVPRGLVTDWYPPDYPRDSASIKVMPARPLRQPVAVAEIESFLHDAPFADFAPEQPVRGNAEVGGLRGAIVRVAGRFGGGPRRMLVTAALADEHYLYRLRLDTGEERAAEREQLFRDMVKTAAALPQPRSTVTLGTADAFSHWAL
jgi:hypothetical protein